MTKSKLQTLVYVLAAVALLMTYFAWPVLKEKAAAMSGTGEETGEAVTN